MCKNKFVTYNFYHKDGKYYILQHSQHIEVSIEVFNAYKNSVYMQNYNDMSYNNHHISLENSTKAVEKELKAQQSIAIEEIYIIGELNTEFLLKFKPKIRQTIILWLGGYNDKEVAEKIGVSSRYVRKIKAQLRQMFQ